jgi:5'(3')-deoxyribonucleotidase
LLVDLDGVLRNFVDGTIQRFELDCTYDDITTYKGLEEKVCEKMKWSSKQFWEAMDADHFESLPMTPWADDLLYNIEDWKPIVLTSPTWTSAGGTQRWIRKYLPKYFAEKRYLIGSCKYVCGFSCYFQREFSCLIDDDPVKVAEFKEAGGEAILFPAPYNENRDLVEFRIDYVVDQLRQLQRDYESAETFDL